MPSWGYFFGSLHMPYRNNSELPDSVKNALPAEAQTTWRTIYNSAAKQYGEDSERAVASAWSGLEGAGWQKGEDGQWHKIEKYTLTWSVPIAKAEDAQRRVFGWGSVAVTKEGEALVDLQGDVIDIADLEEAMYAYVQESRVLNFDHAGATRGTLIESIVFTPEKIAALGVPPGTLPLGAWVGFEIATDDDYALVKAQGLVMFSIEGTARREEVAV